jgi:hypothetical protein
MRRCATIENARAKRGTVDNQVADLGFIRHWPAIASAERAIDTGLQGIDQ